MQLSPSQPRINGVHGGRRFVIDGKNWYVKPCTTREYVAEATAVEVGRGLGLYMHQVKLLRNLSDHDKRLIDANVTTSRGREHRVAVRWGGTIMEDVSENNGFLYKCRKLNMRNVVPDVASIAVLDQVLQNRDRHGANILRYRRRLLPIDHAYSLEEPLRYPVRKYVNELVQPGHPAEVRICKELAKRIKQAEAHIDFWTNWSCELARLTGSRDAAQTIEKVFSTSWNCVERELVKRYALESYLV